MNQPPVARTVLNLPESLRFAIGSVWKHSAKAIVAIDPADQQEIRWSRLDSQGQFVDWERRAMDRVLAVRPRIWRSVNDRGNVVYEYHHSWMIGFSYARTAPHADQVLLADWPPSWNRQLGAPGEPETDDVYIMPRGARVISLRRLPSILFHEIRRALHPDLIELWGAEL